MSGYTGALGVGNGAQAVQSTGAALTSDLMQILESTEIEPGSQPSYALCKAIYTSHPLGAKMADDPINIAQSQQRELSIPDGPEERLRDAFQRTWNRLGVIGTDAIIHNAMKTARIYGISTLGMGAVGYDPAKPLPTDRLHELDLYFNVFDPLNTAGSLVLNQDPTSPDYQRPQRVVAAGQSWHPANTVVMLNEEPVYISYTNSAFGFVGRSVYQRALYPLKSYVQAMRTDDMVVFKAGVLVAKMKAQTSNTTQRVMNMWGWKRSQVKTATSGNVLSIGTEENIESLNMQALELPYRLARENILKNIATAANMPARMLDQETLVSGFGEGQEDAKQIARYINRVRVEMQPLYSFFDDVVQHIAWNPDFYADLQKDFPEYKGISYDVVFNHWRNSFSAIWPNLLIEPESEQVLVDDVRFKSIVALIETLAPALDPDNRASLVMWAAEEVNARKKLFATELQLDEDALRKNGPQTIEGRNPDREPEVPPFAYEDSQPRRVNDTAEKLRLLIGQRKASRRAAER